MTTDRYLLHTQTGGARWTARPIPIRGAQILGLDALNAKDLWAYGPSGILDSRDGGDRWAQASALRAHALDFVSSTVGFGVFNDGGRPLVAMDTRSAGRRWEVLYKSAPVLAVCFLDASVGWLVSQAGTGEALVSRTTDGGQHWAKTLAVPLNGGSGPPAASVGCHDGATWVLVSSGAAMSQESYAVFRTTDHGRSWRVVLSASSAGAGPAPGAADPGVASGSPYSIQTFLAPTADAAVLVHTCDSCARGSGVLAVEMSTDGGASWTSAPSVGAGVRPLLGPLQSASFVSATTGWLLAATPLASGVSPMLMRTIDGGHTWTQVPATISG